jgi:hypothetical protein
MIVYPYIKITFKFLYISKMSITHQIAYCAWLVIVFHVMESLLVDHACRSSVISWLQVTLECACRFCEISCLQVTIPCFFLLLWISYQMSWAQLCHHQLIVPCCLAFMVCRSAVLIWNCWRTALLSWLWLQEGAFTHTITSFVVCLLFTAVNFVPIEQSPGSFVIVGWLSHAVWHRWSAGVQSIVGITGGWHCFRDYRCGKVPSHTITSFAVCLFYCCEFPTERAEPSFVIVGWLIVPRCLASTVCRSAVNSWNQWRMALLLWLRLQEGAFTHYHIFGSCSLVVSDSLACCTSYDSNAWVLLQVQVSTFSLTSKWLHD